MNYRLSLFVSASIFIACTMPVMAQVKHTQSPPKAPRPTSAVKGKQPKSPPVSLKKPTLVRQKPDAPAPELMRRSELIGIGDRLPAARLETDKNILLATELVKTTTVFVVYHPDSKPAMNAFPSIQKAIENLPNKNITLVALCIRTSHEKWVKVRPIMGVGVIHALDVSASPASVNFRSACGIDALPTVIVVDESGIVLDAFSGWFKGDRRLVRSLVNRD